MPTASKAVYRIHTEATAAVLREHGALAVVECWGDDVPDGEVTSFPMAVKCKENETVSFSWIVWPSREVRNAAIPKILPNPRLDPTDNPMPFDGNRMIHDGFHVLVDA